MPGQVETPAPLVLYDGLCGFCDAAVQWLLAHDKARRLQFAPLQGPTAVEITARHPLPRDLDSIILVTCRGTADERVLWHSTAIFAICSELPWPWRAGSWLRLLPRALADFGYRLFARNRYRLWGRKDACRIPTRDERAQFLE